MKPRLVEIDILRTLAALSVIITHISASLMSLGLANMKEYAVIVSINRFCISNVPIFIFISGLVLYYRYENEQIAYNKFLTKRLKATFVPYVGISIFYYLVFIVAGIYAFDVVFLAKSLVLGTMVYHLYFVVIIAQFYVLFGIIKYFFDKFKPNLVLSVALVINVGFFKIASLGFKMGLSPYWFDRTFVSYLFYFCLGCYIAKNRQKLVQLKWSNKVLGGLIVLQSMVKVGVLDYLYISGSSWNSYYNYFWLIFASVDIVLFCLLAIRVSQNLGKNLQRLIKIVGDNSYYIYLIHPLFLMFSEKLVKVLNINFLWIDAVIFTIITFVGAIGVSYVYSSLKAKLG